MISTATGRFFRDLKAFARDAESSCRDLKTNLERPALSASEGGNSAQYLVESIGLQLDDLINEVDQLASYQGFHSTTSHLSLEALYSKCLAVYEKNEEIKEELEIKLEQYSYQRKDPTKQKTAIQQPSKIPTTSKIPVKSTSQSAIPKPNLSSSTATNSSSTYNTSNTSNTTTTNTANTTNTTNMVNAATSIINAAIPTQTLPILTEPATPPSPHTPPKSSNLFDDFPRTPTLDDFGISASALELIAKDQKKQQKKASLTKESSLQEGELYFTTTKTDDIATEKRVSNETAGSRSSTSSVEDGGNFIADRRKPKTKKHREKSGKAPATMFPLMEEIHQAEFNAITPEYLKLSFSLEQLNKAVQKINDHMTDKRFSMEEGVSEGAMESFTEADLRDDMEFGVKAKSLVLLLIQLKRIALDKRFGGTRLTILEKADK